MLVCTLVLVVARPAPARNQCCLTRPNGITKCRFRRPRACVKRHGIDMGSGTCRPDPCAAATTTTSTAASSTTTTTAPGHVRLLIQPLAAPAACGGPGYGTPASPPL